MSHFINNNDNWCANQTVQSTSISLLHIQTKIQMTLYYTKAQVLNSQPHATICILTNGSMSMKGSTKKKKKEEQERRMKRMHSEKVLNSEPLTINNVLIAVCSTVTSTSKKYN